MVVRGWEAEGVEEERVKQQANWQGKQLDEAEIKICFQLEGRLWRLKGSQNQLVREALAF